MEKTYFTQSRSKDNKKILFIKRKPKVFFESDINLLSKTSVSSEDRDIKSKTKCILIHKGINSTRNIKDELLKIPVISRSSTILEMKCLMSQSDHYSSYLLSRKIVREARKKLSIANHSREFQFKQDSFQRLIKMVQDKPNDSSIIVQIYQTCMSAYKYPVSVQLLLLYFGVFLYSMNGMYDMAEQSCQTIYNQLVRNRVQEYLIIYLLLCIKLKTNLSKWSEALKYIMKLLPFAWMFKLVDLEIWCYFELSRAFFFDHQIAESEFFRKKSEMNIVEPETSIYREVIVNQLREEVEIIKDQHYNFNLSQNIIVNRLAEIPPEPQTEADLIHQKRNMHSSIRKLNEVCKIRHVKNLLPRIVATTFFNGALNSQESVAVNAFGGNPHFMTHESRIKNLNMYFRMKKKNLNGEHTPLYTMENSGRSWIVMKQMLRNILLEMRSISKPKTLFDFE